MLHNLMADITRPIKDAMKLAGFDIAAAAAAAVALFFFSLAVFAWAERHYGTVDASLLMAGLFLALAAVIVATALVLRRRARKKQPPPKNNPQWWKDPTILAAGIELVRVVGIRRIIPAVALGAVIVEALQSSQNRSQSK